MSEFETLDHDVLVIGAGGAGLRAAIEAAADGVKVGLVCKSLLGKAHTVMAEGGVAAALGNVDDRDNWRVHFADTMRGGQYVNNWRMAELHAKEAPAPSATTASAGDSASSGRARWSSRPAASAARTRSRATAGSTPATGTRSPTTPAHSSRTWSSCSSTRRG